jgi:S1-C subfamily serine protease
MQDDESGDAQRGGWQPPEYVSPWIPASGPGGRDAGGASGSGEPRSGADDDNDTIAFGNGPAYGPAGYPPPDYVPPGYVPSGYEQQGYGQPGYGQPGYSQYPWGGYGAPPPPPRSGFGRAIAYLAVAVLAAAAGAGAAVALNHSSSAPSSFSPPGAANGQPFGGGDGGGAGNATPFPLPTTGGDGSSQGGTGGTGPLDASALAAKVDPGIVDIASDLTYSRAKAEGTGIIISSSGLVLTNNHVIDEATQVTATLVTAPGTTYTARVVGYDATDDVALLQLVGASGLKPVTLSDSSKAKVGEAVLALGNAGGKGGLPSTAQGTIKALDQSIKASDSGAGTTEQLHGMIETDAPIQEGDSGGPLVNGDGAVIGMDTAANTSGFGPDSTATTGFAIPINTALSIANQISSGKASSTVHIGLVGFMGVNVADVSAGCTRGGDGFGGLGGGFSAPVSSGALICDAYGGAPAAQAGLVRGDVITSVNGTAINSADDLTAQTSASHPGDKFAVKYVDRYGTGHTATVTLTGWAK